MNGHSVTRKPLPPDSLVSHNHSNGSTLETSNQLEAQSDEPQHQSPSRDVEKAPDIRANWPKWRWPLVATLNCIYFLLIGYDVGCIANTQAPIYQSFGQLSLLPWVALGYVAIGVATLPIIRKILSMCDLRWLVPTCAAFLFIGAAVSGSAQSVEQVIVGRCLTGLGGAGIYQLVLTYTLFCTTSVDYSKFISACACSWALGLALGPIIGAGFAENITWRWALYVNLPIVGVVFVLSVIAYPSIRTEPDSTVKAWVRQFDWAGAVVYFTSAILLFCCLMFSGSTWLWSDASTIVAWVLCAVGFTLLARQQVYSIFTTSKDRLLPIDLFCLRPVILTLLATSGVGAAYGISIYYTPLFFAFVHGSGPVQAAVRLLPFTGSFIGCSLLGAGLLPRVKYYAPYYIASGVCITIGSGLLTRVSSSMSQSEVMGLTALIGAGAGVSWAVGATVLTMNVPQDRRLDISAMFALFQIGGIAFSLAIAAIVYRHIGIQLLSVTLRDSGLAPNEIRELMAGLAADAIEQMSPIDRANTINTITQVIGRFYWMLVGAGGVVLVSGCLMDFKPLDYS